MRSIEDKVAGFLQSLPIGADGIIVVPTYAMTAEDRDNIIRSLRTGGGPAISAEDMARLRSPTPMILTCPSCNARHIDEGAFATKPHHTHACQSCGMVWRPALVDTVGVRFLPGFKDAP